MSLFQRAATLAAVTLSLVGAVAHSTAGAAAELSRPAAMAVAATSATTATLQPAILVTPTPTAVPAPAPSPTIAPEADPAAGDVVAYPTLAAAVAAQDVPADIDEQLRCLATAIYYESKGEPLAGQLAVGEVILNRADAGGRFGDDVCAVVTQRGQFSFVRGGRIPDVDAGRAQYRTAVAVAQVAMADAWDSQAGKSLYFHARRVAPGWRRTRVASIGNHIFYR